MAKVQTLGTLSQDRHKQNCSMSSNSITRFCLPVVLANVQMGWLSTASWQWYPRVSAHNPTGWYPVSRKGMSCGLPGSSSIGLGTLSKWVRAEVWLFTHCRMNDLLQLETTKAGEKKGPPVKFTLTLLYERRLLSVGSYSGNVTCWVLYKHHETAPLLTSNLLLQNYQTSHSQGKYSGTTPNWVKSGLLCG